MTKTKQEKHPIEAFAEIEAPLGYISEVLIPELQQELDEVKGMCEWALEVSNQLQKDLGYIKEAGS